jgi:spherulation-specific family 4 protein
VRSAARHQRGVVIASAGAAGAILLVALLTSRAPERRASCRSALIPAYLPPHAIVDLAAGPVRPRLVVINPANGPGGDAHAAYGRAVWAAQDAGARVLGYVPTTYAARPASDVEADVDRYAKWYGVDGIFLDEVSHSAADLPYYAALSRHVRSTRGRFVVLNPGVVPDAGYFNIADVVVTYEGTYADYAAALERMPGWLARQPSERVAHLVYGASREQALTAVRNPARVGYVYATSGSLPDPWRTLPSYLHEEEEALAACS